MANTIPAAEVATSSLRRSKFVIAAIRRYWPSRARFFDGQHEYTAICYGFVANRLQFDSVSRVDGGECQSSMTPGLEPGVLATVKEEGDTLEVRWTNGTWMILTKDQSIPLRAAKVRSGQPVSRPTRSSAFRHRGRG